MSSSARSKRKGAQPSGIKTRCAEMVLRFANDLVQGRLEGPLGVAKPRWRKPHPFNRGNLGQFSIDRSNPKVKVQLFLNKPWGRQHVMTVWLSGYFQGRELRWEFVRLRYARDYRPEVPRWWYERKLHVVLNPNAA